MGLNTQPYKVYNSNDGNLLLLNIEPNWDVVSFNLIKVKPNGDTIFIKSIGADNVLVTKNKNIVVSTAEYSILAQKYTSSYLTMYDKNLNLKWQLDLTTNNLWQGYYTLSSPKISSVIEINPNRYLCYYVSEIETPWIPTYFNQILEFDSLGSNIQLSNISFSPLPWASALNSIGKINNKIFSFTEGYFVTNDLRVNNIHSRLILSTNVKFTSGCCFNNKAYLGYQDTTTHQTGIACIDTSGIIIWNKLLAPNTNTYGIGQITDLISNNNQLIGVYKANSFSCVLSIDSLGQSINSFQIPTNSQQYITNLASLNNHIYTTKKISDSLPMSRFALVKMDSIGNNFCNNLTAFTTSNYTLNSVLYSDTINVNNPNNNYPYSNFLTNLLTYSVSAINYCEGIVTKAGINIKDNNVFSLSPNPLTTVLYITINDVTDKDYSIEIINTTGKSITTCQLHNETTAIDFSKYSIGCIT